MADIWPKFKTQDQKAAVAPGQAAFAPGQLWGQPVPVLPARPLPVFPANFVVPTMAKKAPGTRKNRTNFRNRTSRNKIKRGLTLRYRETAANKAERELKDYKRTVQRRKNAMERDRKRAEAAEEAAKKAKEDAEAAARSAEEARAAEAARVADEEIRREAAVAELKRLLEEEAAAEAVAKEARRKAKREALLVKYKEDILKDDAEIEVRKDEISRASDAIKQATKDIETVQRRLVKEEKDLEIAKESAVAKRETLEKMRSYLSALSNTLNSMKENEGNSFQKNAYKSTKSKKADIERNIAKLESEVKAAYEKIDSASAKIKETELELSNKGAYVESAKKYIGEREERIKKLVALIDELKAGRFEMSNSNS